MVLRSFAAANQQKNIILAPQIGPWITPEVTLVEAEKLSLTCTQKTQLDR